MLFRSQGMLPVFIVPAVEKGKTFSGRRDRLAGIIGVVVLECMQLRASCFFIFRQICLFLTVQIPIAFPGSPGLLC